jgi:hypothetical protein
MKKKAMTMVFFVLFLFGASSAQLHADGPLPVPIPHLR